MENDQFHKIKSQEIKDLLQEDSYLYFNALRSMVLCEISKSEFVEALNNLAKKYPTIIQLNNSFIESLVSPTTIQMMVPQAEPEDFDQQDDDEPFML